MAYNYCITLKCPKADSYEIPENRLVHEKME